MNKTINAVFVTLALSISTNAQANCAPTEVSWGALSSNGKTKQCSTRTFEIKEGQSATYFNSGQLVDGNRYVGSILARCSSGRVIEVSSNCKLGTGATSSDSISESRIKNDNFAPVVTNSMPTENAIASRLEEKRSKASSVNSLEQDNFAFDLSSSVEELTALQKIRSSQSVGAIVGTGSKGSILSGFLPIDTKAVVVEITARFHTTDGSQTKFVDSFFCAPVCQPPLRTTISVVKGGGSGHYWGYEQTAKTLKQINFVAPANTPFTVTLGDNHLLREANVRLNFIPSDTPVPGNPADLFPSTAKGAPVCAGFIEVSSGFEKTGFSPNSTSTITPILSDASGCTGQPITNTGDYRCNTPPRGGIRSCSGSDPTGNLAKSISEFKCPVGTTKHQDNPLVVCRSN